MPRELEDTDKMPFGKHKDEMMQDVPASYLFWLWNNGMSGDRLSPVANYIRKNLSALKQELPDAIWE